MGHRSSKSAIANSSTGADLYRIINSTINSTATTTTATAPAPQRPTELWNTANNNSNASSSHRIPIPLPGTTINVEVQESPTIDQYVDIVNNQQTESDSVSLDSLQNRQIIIKIQLAKMENNGNEASTTTTTATTTTNTTVQQEEVAGTSASATDGLYTKNIETRSAGCGSGSSGKIVNLTLNGNFIYNDEGGISSELASLSSTSSRNSRTAGGSTLTNNNKTNLNNSTTLLEHNSDLQIRLNSLHIQEDWEQQKSNDAMPDYCEVLEESVAATSTANETMESSRRTESGLPDSVGCLSARRKSKTSARPSSVSSLSSVLITRRRCRDAIRRFLEPTTKSLSNNKNKEQNNKKHSDIKTSLTLPALPSTKSSSSSKTSTVLPSTSGRNDMRRQSLNHNQYLQQLNTSTGSTASNNIMPISITTVGGATSGVPSASTTTTGTAASNSLSAAIWSPSRNDLIIPIKSPHLVVVQCAPSSVVTLGRIDDNAIRLTSTDVGTTVNGFNVSSGSGFTAAPTNLTRSIANGPIVHSQVDFVHCLVPDLDKIVNSSFYWGKIDRYEAERLLEAKPEGTFLLRDSAQEEYLFSVTFRKYGRSLHARIEQSCHRFGFDCHDPGVFTAPTVTGLLQHYKDPTCVMFFEPMLTIPLHRRSVFSLQELSRAVIVSNTTYDGITELGLPVRVKSFLKEYHYKQKLRVKPCDETFYSCT